MAPTSAARNNSTASRISATASTIYSDNQSLITEIWKALSMMKSLAVDLEKENSSEMVKELESSVIELLETAQDCACFSSAIQSIGNNYQPGEELTDFKKLLDDEVLKLKARSSFVPENDQFLRKFREAVWHIHHAGQPLPGEEQEDIVMTSTQNNLLNLICPLTGKPITELENPVRSMECKHIYEKGPIIHYIKFKGAHPQCPVAGCPKLLKVERVLCDPLLQVEIEEIRSRNEENLQPTMVEDCMEVE